jgi:hypothetical protein
VAVGVEGTVSRLRLESEGENEVVLRFVLGADSGRAFPVEMQGERLRGVLNEGDRVSVPSAELGARAADATLRPRAITNLTTGGAVEMWRPGLLRRAARAAGLRELRNAAISASVGGVIALVSSQLFASGEPTAVNGEEPSPVPTQAPTTTGDMPPPPTQAPTTTGDMSPPPPSPPPPREPDASVFDNPFLTAAVIVVITFPVVSLAWFALRRALPPGAPRWAVPVGLTLGLALVGIPLSLS